MEAKAVEERASIAYFPPSAASPDVVSECRLWADEVKTSIDKIQECLGLASQLSQQSSFIFLYSSLCSAYNNFALEIPPTLRDHAKSMLFSEAYKAPLPEPWQEKIHECRALFFLRDDPSEWPSLFEIVLSAKESESVSDIGMLFKMVGSPAPAILRQCEQMRTYLEQSGLMAQIFDFLLDQIGQSSQNAYKSLKFAIPLARFDPLANQALMGALSNGLNDRIAASNAIDCFTAILTGQQDASSKFTAISQFMRPDAIWDLYRTRQDTELSKSISRLITTIGTFLGESEDALSYFELALTLISGATAEILYSYIFSYSAANPSVSHETVQTVLQKMSSIFSDDISMLNDELRLLDHLSSIILTCFQISQADSQSALTQVLSETDIVQNPDSATPIIYSLHDIIVSKSANVSSIESIIPHFLPICQTQNLTHHHFVCILALVRLLPVCSDKVATEALSDFVEFLYAYFLSLDSSALPILAKQLPPFIQAFPIGFNHHIIAELSSATVDTSPAVAALIQLGSGEEAASELSSILSSSNPLRGLSLILSLRVTSDSPFSSTVASYLQTIVSFVNNDDQLLSLFISCLSFLSGGLPSPIMDLLNSAVGPLSLRALLQSVANCVREKKDTSLVSIILSHCIPLSIKIIEEYSESDWQIDYKRTVLPLLQALCSAVEVSASLIPIDIMQSLIPFAQIEFNRMIDSVFFFDNLILIAGTLAETIPESCFDVARPMMSFMFSSEFDPNASLTRKFLCRFNNVTNKLRKANQPEFEAVLEEALLGVGAPSGFVAKYNQVSAITHRFREEALRKYFHDIFKYKRNLMSSEMRVC